MALLDVKGLSAGYAAPILQEVSFSLQEGELVGLLGRNGSGKTTFLRALTGSLKPLAGTAEVDGQNLFALNTRKRARLVSLMTQRTGLLEGLRVGEVICMGRYASQGALAGISPQEKELARQVARQLEIESLWDADCAQISEGQRQLVQLARVTVQDASVLLLDEPNSALDFENSRLLFSHIRSLTRTNQHAVLAVLHDPMLALRWCDRLLRLENGRITGSLCPREEEPETIQEFLIRLYPGILVKKDRETGAFYCMPDETKV